MSLLEHAPWDQRLCDQQGSRVEPCWAARDWHAYLWSRGLCAAVDWHDARHHPVSVVHGEVVMLAYACQTLGQTVASACCLHCPEERGYLAG